MTDTVVQFGKCLADRDLLRILNLMRQGEVCGCELEQALDASYASLHGKLQKLLRAGLVKVRQGELWLAYTIVPKYVDLIEIVFETFDSDVGFDPDLARDSRAMEVALHTRVDEWCQASAKKRKSP